MMLRYYLRTVLSLRVAVIISLLVTGVSHSDGLPGEYLLSDSWRQVFSFHSPVDNPAFMMEESYSTFRGISTLTFGDVARLYEIGVVVPLSLFQTAGMTIVGERGGSVSGVAFEGDTIVSTGTTQNSNLFFVGSYAFNPWRKLSLGANLSIAYQNNFGDPRWGVGADLGISYRLLFHPFYGYHVLGLSYRNLLSPQMARGERMPYSSQLKAQYHAGFWGGLFDFNYGLMMSDFISRSEQFSDNEKKLDWDMELQLGVAPVQFLKFKTFAELRQWRNVSSVGIAAGINLAPFYQGRELSVQYQFRRNIKSDLSGLQSLYVVAQFGRHREELFSYQFSHKAQLSPSNLYTRAMNAYSAGDYWDAYFTFSRLQLEYPDFFKGDAVSYYAGSSLEKLDMRDAAIKTYEQTKKDFPESDFASEADLGILRIFYRSENYAAVKRQYEGISSGKGSDRVKQSAAYYMGEAELKQSNYLSALSFFNMVGKRHEAYVFAQHSSATAREFLQGDKNLVMEHLLNVVDAEGVTSTAQKEIVNRSLVLLGYIYYEDNLLSKAVTALRMVPEGSYYFEDAQLGLGWSAVRADQWEDCIVAGEFLNKKSNKLAIKSEGELLQAYGALQKKEYERAEKLLQSSLERLERAELSSLDEIISRSARFEKNRRLYDSLAMLVFQTSKKRPWEVKREEIDELHNMQIMLKDSIDAMVHFQDEQKRIRFFERSAMKLREDIEYALATVQRIRATLDKSEDNSIRKKEHDLSDEIYNLRKKMQNLDSQKQQE